MKKILSLLLAVVMLTASVAAMAAPAVDYIYYDEDDGSYYVFGRYDNIATTSGTWVASDAGVYLNGTKYSYVNDVNTTNRDGKFGIEFKAPKDFLNEFKVQPYSVDSYSEKLGSVKSYDAETNTITLSSNANLSSVSLERDQQNKGGIMALLEPAFDPDITTYVIRGYFENANYNLGNLKIHATAEDPEAVVGEVENHYTSVTENGTFVSTNNFDADGNYQNYKTITVTAKDGTTKTYTFNLWTSNTNYYYTNKSNVARPTEFFSEKLDNGIYTKGTNSAIYIYPQAGQATTQYIVWSFPIVSAMSNASVISLNTSNTYSRVLTGVNKIVVAARAYDNDTKLGKIGGTFTVNNPASVISGTSTENTMCGIDVTEIVKDAIKAGKTSVNIALQIIDVEANGSDNVPGITLTYANKVGSTNNYSASLCWNDK